MTKDATQAPEAPTGLVAYARHTHALVTEEYTVAARRDAKRAISQFILTFLPPPYFPPEQGAEAIAEFISAHMPSIQYDAIAPGLTRFTMDGLTFEYRKETGFHLADKCATCGATSWAWLNSPETLGWHLDHETALCVTCSEVKVPWGARVSLGDLDGMVARLGLATKGVADAEREIRTCTEHATRVKAAFLNEYEAEGASVTERKNAAARALLDDHDHNAALLLVGQAEQVLSHAKTEELVAEQAISLYRAFLYSRSPVRR